MNTIGQSLPVAQPVLSRNRAAGELLLLGDVEESKVPTREQEKDQIICKLLDANEGKDGWIVSIVGLGGSGKTFLAKHVCSENKIKEHFKNQIFWVHVSQEFDVENLIDKLFEAIIEQKSGLHARPHMLREISKKLGGTKFLLVLDDAWHKERHDWEQLLVHLKSGAPGSKILLTTRDRKVAEVVKSCHILPLAFLSEEESWSLFLKKSGWVEEDLGSEFIQIGKEILKNCGGVPLAIKMLGGFLCDKKEIDTWRSVRESNLWNVKDIKDNVFTSLKLSYIHLADHLKQCFTFCSVFPKGHEINKDHLIAQWIAHGFIDPSRKEQPEAIGNEYFYSLVNAGFLQEPFETWQNQLSSKMHDLVHDLSRQILQGEVVTSLWNDGTGNNVQRCKYLSLTSCPAKVEKVSFNKVDALYISGDNPSYNKLVKKICYARSVTLLYTFDAPFPHFILKCECLGYLEIRNVHCTELPESISGCWNLQALICIDCSGFVTLPKSIGKLKKLRTLELNSVADLECLPQSIGDCLDLQCFQLYFCKSLGEIQNAIGKIGNLRGLHVVGCDKVQHLPSGQFSNIQTINLSGCRSLKDLPSTLSSPRLRTLNLSSTSVTTLPECITLIGTLECIELEYCFQLVELPRGLGNLRRLEVLNTYGCLNLRCMPSGFGQLTRLRKLDLFVVGCGDDDARISELENLDMISGNMEITNLWYLKDPCDAEKACLKQKKNIENLKLTWFSSGMEEALVSDTVQGPDVLDALEPSTEMRELHIDGYQGPCLPCWITKQIDSCDLESAVLMKTSPTQFLRLSEIRMENLPNLKHVHRILVLPSLKSLYLRGMPHLEVLWTTTSGLGIGEEEGGKQYCFPVLSHLFVEDCPKLVVDPYFPQSLERLELIRSNDQLLSPGCSFFRVLPEPSSRVVTAVPHLKKLQLDGMTGSSSGWEFLQQLTALESLNIIGCNDLTELPESLRGLTFLQDLWIDECPALVVLPERLGELRSLQHLSVMGCPTLASLPHSIQHLVSLVNLQIGAGGNLKQLPDVFQHLSSLQDLQLLRCSALTVLPESMGQLSALLSLWIHDCPALQSLPCSIQRLTALQRLHITSCPDLARRYMKEVGDDWRLVSHIPDVSIDFD